MAIEENTYIYNIQEIKMTHKRPTGNSTHTYYQLNIKSRDNKQVVYTKSFNKSLSNAWELVLKEAKDMKAMY